MYDNPTTAHVYHFILKSVVNYTCSTDFCLFCSTLGQEDPMRRDDRYQTRGEFQSSYCH